MLRHLLGFILLSCSLIIFGQRQSGNLVLQGVVLGYTNDYTKTIFNKGQKIEIHGSLPDAQIELYNRQEQLIKSVESDKGGGFTLTVPIGSEYSVKYRKQGYGKSAFTIDLRSVNPEYKEQGLLLKNIELILNDFESDHPLDMDNSFGKLYFDNYSKQFEFAKLDYEYKRKMFQEEAGNTHANLMFRSLSKNVHLNKTIETETENEIGEVQKSNGRFRLSSNDDELVNQELFDTVISPIQNRYIPSFKKLDFSELTQEDTSLEAFGEQIDIERRRLAFDKKIATTEEERQHLILREKLLIQAENDLINARKFIAEQEEKLIAQRNFNYAAFGLILLLLIIGFLIWRAYRAKKKSNAIFREKNIKINDSLDYALRIQRSVLLTPKEIEKITPNFFVYYRPLETVSGDFYWFAKVKGHIIVAAVDCTGHGVPGAFMSLIGNTLLNQIVNEKQLITPSEILNELHKGVVAALNQEIGLDKAQDGMDIALCSINESTLKMKFSGAMNPAYILTENQIEVLPGNIQTIGGLVLRKKTARFTDVEFQLKKGDRIFLFSDGYMDQFGGADDKKFNIPRFKSMLLDLKDIGMRHQVEKIDEAFENWKGDTMQIDDVLVIGVEL